MRIVVWRGRSGRPAGSVRAFVRSALALTLAVLPALAAAGCAPTPGLAPGAGEKPRVAWVPAHAGNFEPGPASALRAIDFVVIHDIEGTAPGAIRWFQNPKSRVSAHYVIDFDGAITQMVADRDIAWHAGNRDVNLRSIGIEHAGFADRDLFTAAQYEASGRLVGWLCRAYGIPLDRRHVLAHAEVPDPNDPARFGGKSHHTDPGRFFDWPRLLALAARPAAPLRRTP